MRGPSRNRRPGRTARRFAGTILRDAGGLKTFSDEKAAERWAKRVALDNGLTNVRVTRYNHVAGSRVVLVFNGIADQQVKALLKRSKAEGIGLSVCPKGL